MAPRSILLVDDDRLILATLSDGLEKDGYSVSTASDGLQALEMVKENSPDLAILDIRMPRMSGIDLAQKFMEQNIPFLALTAYSEKETVETMIDQGALGYIVKPVDVRQLIPAIEAAVERANDLKALRKEKSNLDTALSSERDTSKAIGVIMERYRMTADDAFEYLRRTARSERRKLADVSSEIIQAQNVLNRLPS